MTDKEKIEELEKQIEHLEKIIKWFATHLTQYNCPKYALPFAYNLKIKEYCEHWNDFNEPDSNNRDCYTQKHTPICWRKAAEMAVKENLPLSLLYQ